MRVDQPIYRNCIFRVAIHLTGSASAFSDSAFYLDSL